MNTAYPCFSLGYVPFLKTYSLLKLLNILTYKYFTEQVISDRLPYSIKLPLERYENLRPHGEYQLDGLRLESDYTKKTKSKEEKKE